MPVSINNTTLTFNDATTQTTSAVTSIGVGTGISSTGGKTPTLTNTGVTSAVAGTGVSVSGSTGAVTFTNSGVTSIATAGALSASASSGAVTLTTAVRAWANFNGSGGTIRASFNVASITVNGTGDYTINFTTAMPDANYSISMSSDLQITQLAPAVAPTTTGFRINTTTLTAFADATYISIQVFR